jgi:hypothetical protein
MIDHKHRCIFIHIPRAGGTSVEQWLCGQDWWHIEAHTKHLTASQARELYAEFWDEYFKFSLVRNPYERAASLLKYDWFYGLKHQADTAIDWSGYHDRFGWSRFGREIVSEHDHRFSFLEQARKPWHDPGQIYGNILDQPLDFVARLENLTADMFFIAERLNIDLAEVGSIPWAERSAQRVALSAWDEMEVERLYARDFEHFGYAKRALRVGVAYV